jgi:enoyl-CoA hydratase/carnithine racemase
MAQAERVRVHIADGVADVRLNRPDKRNALDQAMFEAIVETGSQLAADHSVRVVVLSGEGKSFCAGLDLSSFEAMAANATTPVPSSGSTLSDRAEGRITNLAQQAAYAWTELPVPVIAAVHGHALGGGLQLALGADVRIVAPDARLSVLEIRWGLVPDMTGTLTLSRLMHLDVVKELVWTGRMVSGEEAVRLGLATTVRPDPRAAALELAHQVAAKSPHAVRAAKRLLNQSCQVSAAQQFLDESKESDALIGSANQLEAVAAALEQRDPVFADPM